MAVINKTNPQSSRAALMANALATGQLEGLEPSPEAAAIFQRFVDGELSLEEMGAAIDQHADVEYGPVRLPRNERS